MYSDVSILEKSEKEILKTSLKEYTNYVIQQAWTLQKIGKIPTEDSVIMDKFQKQLANYNPTSTKDQIIYAQAFDQFNELIEKRRLRLNLVNSGLPTTIWFVLFLGAFVNIVLTWLLVINNRKLDIVINILMGLLLGSLIFLIGAMDNPFRGEYCVTADSFQLLLDGIMKK